MDPNEALPKPKQLSVVDRLFMFDVDGVLTKPETREVNQRVIEFIAGRLDLGKPVALMTGRAFEWVDRKVISEIKKRVHKAVNLDNLFISSEYGGVTVTYEGGIPNQSVSETLSIPSQAKDRIMSRLKPATGVFFDEEKRTMISLEIEGKNSQVSLEDQQTELNLIYQIAGEATKGAREVRVVRTAIAVDIFNTEAGRKLAARQFLTFLEQKGVRGHEFVVFGDTPFDIEATDELYQGQQLVHFAYVGREPIGHRDYPIITIPGEFFDEATEKILTRF